MTKLVRNNSVLGPSSGFAEPLLVLIEYIPYGDLLGYLRKSRGLNDTYFEDPDIKPQTCLTSQQLMRFSQQIADGMNYLCSIKVTEASSRGLIYLFESILNAKTYI